MQPVAEALREIQDLYEKVVGSPAPKLEPDTYQGFPFGVDPIQYAVQEVSELKKVFEQLTSAPHTARWTPIADTFASPDTFVVRMEITGVSREDLKVFIEEGECVVQGERKPPEEMLRALSIERPWGTFERRFVLPHGSRGEAVNARFADGVLEVKIPLAGSAAPERRAIEVD